MKKYGIYENGKPVVIHHKDEGGHKVTEEVRAGTKGAARRLAKRYGATWRAGTKEKNAR